MVWRATPQEARRRDGRSRKAALQRRVWRGVSIGILGYLDGEPVAWVSIAPRPTYRRLGGVDDPLDKPEKVWSLVCFFATRRVRGHGLMTRLLTAAVEARRWSKRTPSSQTPPAIDSRGLRLPLRLPASAT